MPKLEFLADLYLSVGTPVQRALPGLLDLASSIQSSIREAIGTNLTSLREAVRETAVDVLPVEAGWVAVLRIPRILDDESFTLRLLEEESTVVQPGYLYDFADERSVVVSLLTAPEVFREGIGRLLAVVGRL
jgi:aspartate/methionine/tyrosine aminotransferase